MSRFVTRTSDPPMPAVTAKMVYNRGRALATAAGRGALHVRQTDYDRARKELTRETENASPDDAPACTAPVSGPSSPLAPVPP